MSYKQAAMVVKNNKNRKRCSGSGELQSEKWCSSLKLLNFMKLFIVGKFVEKNVNKVSTQQIFG